MNRRSCRLFIAFSLLAFQALGQNPYDISTSYTLERLVAYEKVKVSWQMPGQIQVEMNEGINYLLEGRPIIAVSNFTRALAPDSSLWIAYYYRGAAFKRMGNLIQAENDFRNAFRLNNNSLESLIELAKTQHLLKKTEDAFVNYKKAVEVSPESFQAHYWSGEILLLKNEPEQARKHFARCLELNPSFSPANIKLAFLRISESKNVSIGLGHLNDAILKDSTSQEALLIRALILVNAKPKEAAKDFDRLVSLSPFNIFYLAIRGQSLVALGEYNKAFSDFQKVLQSSVKQSEKFIGRQTIFDKKIDLQYATSYTLSKIYGLPEKDIPHIKKGYCLLLTGKHYEAIEALKKVNKYSSLPLCIFLTAIAEEHAGNHEAAWKFYEEALKLDNEIIDAHKKAAIYNSNIGEWKKSEMGFTKALNLNDQLNSLYKLRGVTRYRLNDFKGAIEDFDRFLLFDSTDFEAKENRYLAYDKLGIKIEPPTREKPSAAEAAYLKRMFWKMDARLSLLPKAKLMMQLKKYDSALTDLNKLIDLNASDIEVLRLRVQCNSFLGNQKKVAEDIKTILSFNKDNQELYFVDYRRFLEAGDTATAKVVLQVFAKKWPDYIDVYLAQAELFASSKKYDSVIYMVGKVLNDRFKNPKYDNFSKAYYLKSIASLAIGDVDMAMQSIEKALGKSPGTQSYLFQKAMVLLKLGREKESDKIIEDLKGLKYLRALNYRPNSKD